MAMSRIEELIEDIFEFVEECKMQPLSSTKVIVPKEELYDLLDELRMRTPDEIKRYQKMIENKDAILADAEEKANAILADAQQKMDALVDEHEIMQQAYAQADAIVQEASMHAQQILDAAEHDANEIRTGAIGYTSDMLAGLENIMDKAYADCKNHYEGLMHSMQGHLDIVRANRRELNGTPEPETQEQPEAQAFDESEDQKEQKVIKHQGIIDDYAMSEDY